MAYKELLNQIDDMVSSFLSLEDGGIDIPAAGRFLNQLETILAEAEARNLESLKVLARGMSVLLEKIVLDDVDRDAGLRAFERAVVLMQEIGDGCRGKGGSRGDSGAVLGEISALTGFVPGDPSTGETAGRPEPETPCANEPPAAEHPAAVLDLQDRALLSDFITEALEYIGEIEVNILNLEQNPENKETINAIFRPFHSIKGVAGFLNLETIRDLAHDLETLLDHARNGELDVSSALIDVILDGADALKSLVGNLRNNLDGREEKPLEIDVGALKRRIQGLSSPEAGGAEVKKLGAILVEEGTITQEMLDEALSAAQTPPPKKLGETLIAEKVATPKQVSQALRKQGDQAAEINTVRVDTKKLDDLIDLVGELVINQSMIRQNPRVLESGDRKLSRDISQMASIVSELQRLSTNLRMIPIRQTFQKMARMVRDLAKKADKVIQVEMIGEDTEADKNMIEEISSPLVHMIRNAVDHGIERPEERTRAGKPEGGTIRMRAYHRGGNIVIEVSDDGKGLSREKIREKAVKNGLISATDNLTETEVIRLILQPGFSTAETVTEISGRGVGMDVVKSAVDKLRGKIEIASKAGAGSTFTLSFPLTMAIIDGMIVKVGRQRYILPTTAVRQLIRPTRESYNRVVGGGETISVMGKFLPLVRLHELFNVEPVHSDPWEATCMVLEGENRGKCLLVDEIIGKEEIVIKSLGDSLKRVKGVSGGAILGDGSVGLILDPEGIFELSETAKAPARGGRWKGPPPLQASSPDPAVLN